MFHAGRWAATQRSAIVTVEGYLSVTDFAETGLFATAIGFSSTVTVLKAASGDEYTLANAVLQSRTPIRVLPTNAHRDVRESGQRGRLGDGRSVGES
jgi:hypothetical protein